MSLFYPPANPLREPCQLATYIFEIIPENENAMRLLLAIFLPCAVFFTIGRPLSGILCLILQITLIGWLPAALWAVYALSVFRADQKVATMRKELVDQMNSK